MKNYKNKYENSEIIVTFIPQKCIHAEKCAIGLSEVFRSSVIPWINLEAASTKKIISQIRKCPSEALNFRHKKLILSA
ncbi:MAG: (4Fe-4S)-binding protein [Flavobacteriaceae bacterium]|nr:(4Fe-4S)-binding protein [Flavobacteriaceae bacterium]